MFRLLHLSDTHLSPERAYCAANFDAMTSSFDAHPPDLVVAGGDLVLDDPDHEPDQEWVRARFAQLGVPWRAIPGNHDIGDSLPEPWMDQPVTTVRRDRWVARWGQDRWVEEAEGWLVVGLNSLLFDSNLPAEAEQWEWVTSVAQEAGRRPVMLVLHKPLCMWDPDELDVTQTAVTPVGRARLRDALGAARVRLVASGHVHEYRAWAVEGMTMVWAPSTGFIAHRTEPSRFGATKMVGAVEYRFDGRAVAWSLRRAAGMVDQDVVDIAGTSVSLRTAPLFAG